MGELAEPMRLDAFVERVAKALPATAWGVRAAGEGAQQIRRVAVCGGSGGELAGPAAALGAQVEVPTLEGRVKLTVPPGSPDGRALRLAGKGAPRLKGGGRGDLIATLRLDVPRELSDTQRDALEKFAELDPRDPRETLFS